jgi:hypothetical protein
MKYEVKLRLHENSDQGTWGVCHENALDKFDPFWGADGIFHDVFEHYHEEKFAPFIGRNAFGVYGEMAASGAGIAYSEIGIDNFKFRPQRNVQRDFIADTTSILTDYIHGYDEELEFPLIFNIPRQRDPKSDTLNAYLYDYFDWLNDHIEKGRTRAKELSKSKIKQAYFWGYNRAKKIIGSDENHAYDVLDNFLDDWNTITKNHNPEYLWISGSDYGVRNFIFKINTYPKLKIRQYIQDDIGNLYSIHNLEAM